MTTQPRGQHLVTVQTTDFAAAPRAGRIGQATAVEQSRAVAEVQAAIVVARQFPREMPEAIRGMEEACRQKALAERAFFRFNRGGSQVSGPSVHLARELARCWGNLQFGVSEMRRDDEHAQSEMQAYAWDVETNTRNVTTFIVPHMRDARGGQVKLTDMRDIYENNANNAARRLREVILSTLPTWYVERAKALCTQTLVDGGGVPLAQRVAQAIEAFEALGVRRERVEARLDRVAGEWTAQDVAQLVVIHTSIKNGEVTVADEFPSTAAGASSGLTAEDLSKPAPTATPAAASPAARAPHPQEVAAEAGPAATSPEPTPSPVEGLWKRINAWFSGSGLRGVNGPGQKEARLKVVNAMVADEGRTITQGRDLTEDEARIVLDTLAANGIQVVAEVLHGPPPAEYVQAVEQSAAEQQAEAEQTYTATTDADLEPQADDPWNRQGE